MTLRGELLTTRHDLLGAHGCQPRPSGLEPHGVGPLHAFRALQVDEMLQRRLAEWEQAKLHTGRIALRLVGKVWPAHKRRRPNGGQQILDHRPMQHLLGRDVKDHLAPTLHGRELTIAKARTRCAPQAERGVEVLAHQRVFQLGSQGEQVGQLLAPLHHHERLARHAMTVSAIDRRTQWCRIEKTGSGAGFRLDGVEGESPSGGESLPRPIGWRTRFLLILSRRDPHLRKNGRRASFRRLPGYLQSGVGATVGWSKLPGRGGDGWGLSALLVAA